MEFDLNEEQRMIRKMVRDFAEKEIAPKAAELDETKEFPWETIATPSPWKKSRVPVALPPSPWLLTPRW